MNHLCPASPDLFQGRHTDPVIIFLCVRWYITDELSYRDLVEMIAERGIAVAHTIILRWVKYYVPEFEKRWSRYARPFDTSWRVHETYIKVRGRWTYLYYIRHAVTGTIIANKVLRKDSAAQFAW